jgi:hypothetical protein
VTWWAECFAVKFDLEAVRSICGKVEIMPPCSRESLNSELEVTSELELNVASPVSWDVKMHLEGRAEFSLRTAGRQIC